MEVKKKNLRAYLNITTDRRHKARGTSTPVNSVLEFKVSH
jgi:hypothetical protein